MCRYAIHAEDTLNIGVEVLKGLIAGTFDLFHPGHVHTFNVAKCELIVALHTHNSSKRQPIQTIFERYVQLKAHRNVVEVIPYDTELDLERMMETTTFDYYFVSEEYPIKSITGYDILNRRDISIIQLSRKHRWSTTMFLNRIRNEG